jgi:hypothetical protein
MTNSARISVDMEFADGVTRSIKPLTIRRLRKFMKLVEALSSTDASKMTDDDIDKMMEAAAVVVEQSDPELAADEAALEDAVDVDIFWKLIQIAMGNKISDPNE